jgi:hypothetical protein
VWNEKNRGLPWDRESLLTQRCEEAEKREGMHEFGGLAGGEVNHGLLVFGADVLTPPFLKTYDPPPLRVRSHGYEDF